MRRASTTLATIKKNLTPSKKSKKDKGHASNRKRRGGNNNDDGSDFSSSASSNSFDESSYSSLSGSGSESSRSSSASSSLEKYSRSRKSKDHDRRYRHSRRDDKRRHNNKDKRRSRRSRRDRDRYPSSAYDYSTPQRHVNPTISNDEATQMVDLLMRILPFYGRGDGHIDAVVVDTIHRLPPQALETQDIDGNTLLMLACQSSAFDLVPALLAKGCNVNTCNNVGAGCLHFACFTDSFSPDAAMTLIRHGATAERVETEFGCSPLHWASFSGHIELCTALCRAGANPLTLDKNGCDPIYYAMENGHGGCATLLKTFSENTATAAPSATSSTEWVRCLDHTGASFYHNNDTGESLWGEDFRKVDESVTAANLDHVQNSAGTGESKENEGDIDIDTNSVSNTGTTTVKVTEETALSPIAEDTTGNEQLESHHLTEIIEDAIEASSVEGDQPDQINNEDDKAMKEKKDNVPPLQQLSVKADTVEHSISNNNETDLLARNESFEARLSSLHQRMETQLMDRLQHLEDKIAKQNLEASISTKAANDGHTSKTNENIAQSYPSTILQLQTEQGRKDLEILSLKQQILTLETEKISQHKTSMSVGIGDGDILHDDVKPPANANYEQELIDARKEIVKLKKDVVETKQSLDTANERCEQAQRNTEIAEQLARDEKAARLKSLEVSSDAEKSLSKELQEELRHSEEIIVQMKARIRTIEDSTTEEKRNYSQQLEQLQSQEEKLVKELEMSVSDLEVMKDHHKSELSQTKEDLENVHSELEGMRGQTREAKMAKMEMLLAKDEAELAKDEALEKARVATRKLKDMTDFVNKATELKAVNDRLHISLHDETEKRKVLHNNLEDLKGRIRVYVRVRPLSSSEMKANYANVLTKEDDRTCVMSSDAATSSDVRDWEFDKIFSGSAHDGNTQEAIFKDTSLLITSAIDGFNVCIFAYGQTGSGKTYTMLGSGDSDDAGLAPRVAHELFRKLNEKDSSHHVEVSTSMFELYTDKLRDLLVANGDNEGSFVGDLKIRLAEHTSSGLVEVDNARIERVANAEELLDVFHTASLGRASSSTKMNSDSSRSHMIATIVLSLRNRRTGKVVHGKLTLVDLAGSERVSKSGATGQQLKEAQSINKSLSALGDVIGALTSVGRQHIPYRNHPLTMLMSDSIGGNAKTLMFVCCSPADYNMRESANSLDFAKRCRNVTNNAVTGKGGSASQIRALRAELARAKKESKSSSSTPKRLPAMRRPGM